MCARDPFVLETGGPGPAQTTPMTYMSATGAHRHPDPDRAGGYGYMSVPCNLSGPPLTMRAQGRLI